MRTILTVIFLCTFALNAYGDPLKNYKWENRLVLYSISGNDADKYQMNSIISNNQQKIVDRDMLFFDLNNKDSGNLFVELSTDDAQELKQIYNVKPAESVFILIGKDGGEKERLRSKFDLQYFFNKIDLMPMRIDEMNGL